MKSLHIVALGGIAGAVLLIAIYWSEGVRSSLIAGIVGAALAAGLTSIAVGRYVESHSYYLSRRVPIPAAVVRDHATDWFGRAPWMPAKSGANKLVFWRKGEPRLLTAVLLLLLGIIPGVLYLVLSRGEQTIALGISPASNETVLDILVHPQGDGGRGTVVRFFNSLHDLGPSST